MTVLKPALVQEEEGALPQNERDDASNDAAALAIVIDIKQAGPGLSSISL